jgi:hypothetical protein
VRPETVVVELCRSRVGILYDGLASETDAGANLQRKADNPFNLRWCPCRAFGAFYVKDTIAQRVHQSCTLKGDPRVLLFSLDSRMDKLISIELV